MNVNSAEAIGTKIVRRMEGQTVAGFKFSKKEQVTTLASAVYVAFDGEQIENDPQQFYQRLLVAGVGTIDIQTLFQYELCSYPISLFDKYTLMRMAAKADLQHDLVKRVPSCIMTECPAGVKYVIDGGAMLQRPPWPKASTYGSICQLYRSYICNHYQNALVVFDGYENGPSTKDETHQRRVGSELGVDVDLGQDMMLKMKKKPFLANPRNEQKFIYLLASELQKEECVDVKHAREDADVDIVQSACAISTTCPVIVVGDDTDLLVLLIHHFDVSKHKDIFMQTSSKLISVYALKQNLDDSLISSLLFIHSLTGCDTTSRPHGIGKVSALAKHANLKVFAKMFMLQNKTSREIEQAGKQALGVLYGCIPGSTLDFERQLVSAPATSHRSVSHQHVMLQDLTVGVSTYKYRFGWVMSWIQQNGAGIYKKKQSRRHHEAPQDGQFGSS